MRTPRSSWMQKRMSSGIQAVAATLAIAGHAGAAAAQETVALVADRDDDDANGMPDCEQSPVPLGPELFAVQPAAPGAHASSGTDFVRMLGSAASVVRVLADGKPLQAGQRQRDVPRRLQLQAIHAGTADVEIFGRPLHVRAFEVRAIDGDGRDVDLARSHASLQRMPPDRLADDPLGDSHDPDALRFVLVGDAEDFPGTLRIVSLTPSGIAIDALATVALGQVPCPPGTAAGMTCASTPPIRAVADDIDRSHPLIAERSIKVELGGAIIVARPRGDKLQLIRVGGPRRTDLGPITRLRAHIRVRMVRSRPRGSPPMGGDTAGAIAVARDEVKRANALWAACGISFGRPEDIDIQVVDPPRPHLLAIGCDHGMPSSGGEIRLKVEGRDLHVPLRAGMRPDAVARLVASAITSAGFVATVSDNATIGAGAFGSSDVLVRRHDGTLATLERPPSGAVSTDATLAACIGAVDLDDGLQHFGDVDAIAGTVEERTLIKAFDDGDPRTIKVFLVPSFGGGGRIGESFISADGGAIRNVILEDRAGIRADRASFALAHELGHVLLDDPGHPDDFGADTPTRLMDADAANGSAYGPRRLLVDECVRVLRQSGPSAPVPLLTPWPLVPIGREK